MELVFTRRRFVTRGAAIAAALAAPPIIRARADAPVLNVLAHRIMRTVCSGPGGDATAAWSQRTGSRLAWLTFDQGPLQERLLRELALPETTIDLAFILNSWLTPRTAGFLEPLDAHNQAAPIEDIGDIFPSLIDPLRFDGALCGVPFRHSTDGLHYNEVLLAERGFKEPPRTIEDFAETARAMTYKRPNGATTWGFAIPGAYYGNVVDIARAWNGDFITTDRRYVGNEPPMVSTISLLRELYAGGNLPRNFTALNSEDVNPLIQTGRAAMSMAGIDRNRIYNDADKSLFPGGIKTTFLPVARSLQATMPIAPAKTEFWSLVIPKNSRNKKQAWELLCDLLSKSNTVIAALNGNGPVRESTYEDPRFTAIIPYAADARLILKSARVPMPAFDHSNRVADMFKEQVDAAVLGMKTPQLAMDDLGHMVQPLLS
jgi:multiple sugar transport system substrate-binding protein